METDLHLDVSRYYWCGAFTQLLSGIGVERGRLGEVVSLVGDCRPPPPGNPHRPPMRVGGECGGSRGYYCALIKGAPVFPQLCGKSGELCAWY